MRAPATFPTWWRAVLAALTLQINPTNASILSLYVILLLLTPVAIWALLRRKAWLLAGMSVALYVAGQLLPSAFTLPRLPRVEGQINWATWQALFFSALVVGWYWNTVRVRLLQPRVWLWLLLVSLGVGALARVRLRVLPASDGPFLSFVDWFFEDGTLGPGSILLALAVVGGLYGVLTPLCDRVPRAAMELGRIGRRSLDCYVILSLFVLVVPIFWRPDPRSLDAVAYGLALLLLMWVWCRARDHQVRVTALPDACLETGDIATRTLKPAPGHISGGTAD